MNHLKTKQKLESVKKEIADINQSKAKVSVELEQVKKEYKEKTALFEIGEATGKEVAELKTKLVELETEIANYDESLSRKAEAHSILYQRFKDEFKEYREIEKARLEDEIKSLQDSLQPIAQQLKEGFDKIHAYQEEIAELGFNTSYMDYYKPEPHRNVVKILIDSLLAENIGYYHGDIQFTRYLRG